MLSVMFTVQAVWRFIFNLVLGPLLGSLEPEVILLSSLLLLNIGGEGTKEGWEPTTEIYSGTDYPPIGATTK